MSIEVAAGLRQTLRVRGIPISYQGPDAFGSQVSLARSTLADFVSTASMALAMFPVEDGSIRISGVSMARSCAGRQGVAEPGRSPMLGETEQASHTEIRMLPEKCQNRRSC
jgi:hypothetical protein